MPLHSATIHPFRPAAAPSPAAGDLPRRTLPAGAATVAKSATVAPFLLEEELRVLAAQGREYLAPARSGSARPPAALYVRRLREAVLSIGGEPLFQRIIAVMDSSAPRNDPISPRPWLADFIPAMETLAGLIEARAAGRDGACDDDGA